MGKSADRLFLDFSITRLTQLTTHITDCLGRLRDDQVWARGSENENAIGNLVLHLNGNVRQWITSAIGGAADTRVRDQEFAARGGASAPELADTIRKTVAQAAAVLEGVTAGRLCDSVRIQGRDTAVLEAIYHVVEHFALHTGQIIYATKHASAAG